VTILLTCSYRAFRPEFGTPVVASLQLPRWIPAAADWPQCTEIMPRWRYFRAGDWEAQYRAQLARYGPRRIARRLEAIAREQDADRLVILCFEALPTKCHRGLFAEWLLVTTGEAAEEAEAVVPRQLTLPIDP
jgi:hypothetical protein